jgi:hypothetical protein
MVGVDLETSSLPDGQLTTHADLRIAFHEAVAATSTLPNKNVRLIGLRRGSIIAEFELTGTRSRVMDAVYHLQADLATAATSKLGKTLCEAASAGRDAPVQCHTELMRTEFFEGTEITPGAVAKSAADESESNTLAIALIVAASAIVVVLIAAIAYTKMKRGQNQQVTNKAVTATEVQEKGGKDNFSECGSTATPPSEKVSSEVQTEVSGEISEVGSRASSRECTLEVSDEQPHQSQAKDAETIVDVQHVCVL